MGGEGGEDVTYPFPKSRARLVLRGECGSPEVGDHGEASACMPVPLVKGDGIPPDRCLVMWRDGACMRSQRAGVRDV